MKLVLKIIGITFAGIVGLVVLAFIALQFISDEQYKKWLTGAAESATGRTLVIGGEFDVQIGSTLGLAAHDVRFANAEWGSRTEMVTADRLLVQLQLLPLFKGMLDVTVELDAPDIMMETNMEGTGNWVFGTGDEKQGAEDPVQEAEQEGGKGSFKLPVKPYIRNFQVSDLVFVFADGANEKRLELTLETLRIFVDGTDIPLNLKGAYQSAPIELAGSLGNIEQWYANEATPVSLQGLLNETDLLLKGTAGPLLPKPNARIDIALSAADVSTFAPFAGIPLPQLANFDLSLTFLAEDGQLAGDNFKLNLNDPRLLVAVEGTVANLTELSGIDIKAEITSDQTTELLKELELPIQYSLPKALQLTAGVNGNMKKLGVSDLELLVKDSGLNISLTGALENVLGSGGGTADLSVNLESTSIIGEYIGQEIPALGPIDAMATLSLNNNILQLESLQLNLQDPALTARVDGSVQKIARTADEKFEINGIEIKAEAATSQLAEIIARAGVELPFEVPSIIDLKMASAGSLDKLEITDFLATIKDTGVEINLTGTVDNIIDQSGIAVQLSGMVDDTATLSRFTGVEVPALGSLNLNSNLSSIGDSYRLDDLKLSLDGELIRADISAAVTNLMALTKVAESPEAYASAGIDVSLNVSSVSASNLARKAGVDLPEIGSLEVEGHLGSSETALKLDILKATLTQDGIETKANVEIEDIVQLSGIKAVIDGNLDSLSTLSELARKELPETGPWVVNIQADTESPESPVSIVAKLEGEGTATVLEASLPDLKAPQTFQTKLTVDVESITRIGRLLGKEIPKDKTMKIVGKVFGKPGKYHLEEFIVRADEGEIQANLAYLTSPAENVERNSLIGDLTINDFDFTDFLATKEETTKAEAEESAEAETVEVETETVAEKESEEQQSGEAPTTGKRIFSDEPLSIGMLRKNDIDLKIDATNVRIPNGIDMNGKIAVNLDDGFLRVDLIDLDQTSGGSGKGYIKLDARNEEAVLDVALDFDDFVSPRFGGLFDLDVDLDGKGQSLADLMGSLNGHFAASMKEMELQKSFMSQFGAGLLSKLNPLDRDKTTLECAVIRFDIEDGIADFHKKIAAQTTEVTWLGGGEINLKTEELDVGIAPKARGAVSGLTNLNLASLVHVGGTLAEPKIGVDLVDVAKKYAGYTAFVATGGLSFLASKMVGTVQANVDQCKRILGDQKDGQNEESKTDSEK